MVAWVQTRRPWRWASAASAFTSAYDSFSADFTQVLNALQGIQEKLTATRTRYQATEETQTAAASRVQSLLNR